MSTEEVPVVMQVAQVHQVEVVAADWVDHLVDLVVVLAAMLAGPHLQQADLEFQDKEIQEEHQPQLEVLAVVAEMVGNPEGLGYGIVREQQALRPDLMFANIIVIGVLGLALNSTVLWLTGRLSPALSSEVVR